MDRVFKPLIIDVEASGLGQGSYPIEVGVALAEGDKFCRLIQPVKSWSHWDEHAEQVHHISRENLMENGHSTVDVAKALNSLLKDKVLYTDGWVVDKPWLTMLFHEARQTMQFRVSPIEIILTEKQMELWHQTKEQIIAETNLARHRASNDAWLVQETYHRTKSKQPR